MADNSEKAAYMARILAIVHIVVGFHLFCFGIADLVVSYRSIGFIGFGIWIGVWVSVYGSSNIYLCASLTRKRADIIVHLSCYKPRLINHGNSKAGTSLKYILFFKSVSRGFESFQGVGCEFWLIICLS